jgi:hypothetical protein
LPRNRNKERTGFAAAPAPCCFSGHSAKNGNRLPVSGFWNTDAEDADNPDRFIQIKKR